MEKKIPQQAMLTREEADKLISPKSSEQQAHVHRTVGGMLISWATAESTFGAIVQRAASVSFETASVIFTSHTANASKMKLVVALANLNLKGDDKQRVLDFVKKFKEYTAIRNELAHAEYALNKEYFYVATISMKADKVADGDISLKNIPIDDKRMTNIIDTQKKLNDLGADIWRWCSEFDQRSTD